MAGLRPDVEIMMVEFIGVALDALLNHAAKLDAFTGGLEGSPGGAVRVRRRLR